MLAIEGIALSGSPVDVATLRQVLATIAQLRETYGGKAIFVFEWGVEEPDVPVAPLPMATRQAFDRARDALAADLYADGMNYVAQARAGLRPEFDADNIDEITKKTKALINAWQRRKPIVAADPPPGARKPNYVLFAALVAAVVIPVGIGIYRARNPPAWRR
ncbi:MAG: hypothetical protein JSV86_10630 [Gemmatimonadota bacterium]|nr:MAG: hypothetical protein JSV86_10630 [Gemmatimonadota bacterium]